jgi:hypothetical protein
VTLEQSLLVVSPLELPQARDQFREGGVGSDSERVLFQGADEPLGDAIAFRRSRAVVSSEPSPATPLR